MQKDTYMNTSIVTVTFGLDNQTAVNLRVGTDSHTVGEVLRRAKPELGFGDNIEAAIDGEVQNLNAPVQNGDTITVRTRANAKA